MLFISAGHHPAAPGACFGSFCEYDEANVWADIVVQSLQAYPYAVLPVGVMRVPGMTLKDKTAFINARAPILAVEIHFNSAKDKDGKHIGQGCETLYYPGSDLGLKCAGILQESINGIFPPDRGPKEGYYRGDKSKGPVWFLEKTKCPALIVEPEFIHHKEEIQKRRDVACTAIAAGVMRCVNELEGVDSG